MTKKKTDKQFIKEIYALVKDEYTILNQYNGAHNKVKVRHNKCGNEYEVSPSNILRGKGCPKCYGTFKKEHNIFIDEVKALTENNYTVLGEYINAKTKILIKHSICGFEYNVKPHDFLAGRRCPRCNESNGERIVRKYLETQNIKYVFQYKIKECKNINPLPFDFAILDGGDKLLKLIEFNGMQHYRNMGYIGSDEKLKKLQTNDKIKESYCKSRNLALIKIPYTVKNIEEYLDCELRC